ncbi:tetraacyldisaccharide 4'-kinase [Spirosoma sp. RP8]|uniref:Tetraacyldisaccharide 4'-kinase n=1 Tax=Spirosoma liriopis TaxID=2937440 RepID=A0ABT0HRB7_9BACT|nr:tetraacyldisaccharide 4'-kinase [Spirosoma liriopis]MCK8494530.1 tetraacyldisaccharide 4'-kinase [Spirosoma liriopis]
MAANLPLLPFSSIYGLITDARNWLYDSKLYSSFEADSCVIAVGNLTVGGTGKTPMIEYLIKRHLPKDANNHFESVTLSRGYGRRTKEFREATNQDTAETIGDEPLQLYRKFARWVRVFVGERRADAIQQILAQYPETKRILLDDAFQHRAVQPQLNVLLTDYNRLFYTDHPFPAGRLRERRHGARRADVVIVTKCPDTLSKDEQETIRRAILRYTRPKTPVLFSRLQYGQPTSFATHKATDKLSSVVLVSGLANATPLETYVRQVFSMEKHHRFGDHHAYTRAELDRLTQSLSAVDGLLTTEKDWVKIDALLTDEERLRLPLYYLPVEMAFLSGYEAEFDDILKNILLKNP